MGVRELFRSLLGSSRGGSREEARRLAVLLLTEVEVFGAVDVEEARRSKGVSPELAVELERAYDVYLARIDDDPELRADFAREAARRFADGDESVLRELFQRLDARPGPAVRPR